MFRNEKPFCLAARDRRVLDICIGGVSLCLGIIAGRHQLSFFRLISSVSVTKFEV